MDSEALPITCAEHKALYIDLTQGQRALVDAEDYDRLSKWKWYANKIGNSFYAIRNIARGDLEAGTVLMHRGIMAAAKGMHVDHINGNGIDNRKCNMRVCSHIQNLRSSRIQGGRSSQYKGVSFSKTKGKWRGYICPSGKYVHLGYFVNEIDAARAYNEAAVKYFGEFARINELPPTG